MKKISDELLIQPTANGMRQTTPSSKSRTFALLHIVPIIVAFSVRHAAVVCTCERNLIYEQTAMLTNSKIVN